MVRMNNPTNSWYSSRPRGWLKFRISRCRATIVVLPCNVGQQDQLEPRYVGLYLCYLDYSISHPIALQEKCVGKSTETNKQGQEGRGNLRAVGCDEARK